MLLKARRLLSKEMDNDCENEQQQELEALESMYPSEFKILHEHYPHISIEVQVRIDSDDFENTFHKDTALFRATLPATYPNTAPLIDLGDLTNEQEENTDNEQTTATQRKLIQKVQEELSNNIQECLGMPMLFTLINAFQESLVNVCAEHSKDLANAESRRIEQAEKEEMARFEGTRVTVESFNKWNKAFIEEIRLKDRLLNKDAQTITGRMTGKQMFLADKSLNISDLQFLNVPLENDVMLEDEKQLKNEGLDIDESLFEGELDISDSSDEDYEPE